MVTSIPTSIRPPAVAGSFYPDGTKALRETVTSLLAAAREPASANANGAGPVKALIVPHAGYVYSGPIAASAYRHLERYAGTNPRVVLLGPAHRAFVRGLALPSAGALRTPLGDVPVWKEGARAIADLPQVVVYDPAHEEEHSLEVQLPFLQVCLGTFQVLPLAVGDAEPEEVAEVLERVWGGPETLLVLSTDLSHYLDYDTARRLDTRTAQRIVAKDAGLSHEHACGATPLCGLLHAARKRHMDVSLLDLRSSGDTAGDRTRVVGYGAFLLREAAR